MSTSAQPPARHDSLDDSDAVGVDPDGAPESGGRRGSRGASPDPVLPDAAEASAGGVRTRGGGEPVRRRVRRSPNYVAFLVTGAFLGFVVGAVVDLFGVPTVRTAQDPLGQASYSAATSFGFVGVVGAIVGVLVAALVALALDRRG